MRSTLAAFLAIGTTLWLFPARAAAPPVIPIQGVLTDTQGAPLDGPQDVTFTIYDAQSGGTSQWNETQTLTVVNGLFTAFLGQVNALDLALFRDQGDLWLGIRVGADPEMPLVRLGSAPYSGFAEHSGAPGVPAGMIAAFDSQCPTGWTRVAALDGQVLRGSTAFGATGGSDNHNHTVNPPSTGTSSDGSHSHSASWTTRNVSHDHSANPPGTNTGPQQSNHTHGYDSGVSGSQTTSGVSTNHNHYFDPGAFTTGSASVSDRYPDATGSAGGHAHSVDLAGVSSSDGSSWPPYTDVIYCRKDAGRTGWLLRTPPAVDPALKQELAKVAAENERLRERLMRLERLISGEIRTARKAP